MNVAEDVREAVEEMFLNAKPNIAQVLGIEFQSLAKDEVVVTMPVDHRTHQPFGILHGGASVVLAETACSVGAWLNVDRHTQTAVGLEINANHLRPVRTGMVTATARPVHVGALTQVWEVVLHNDAGHQVCISRCTLAVIKKR
jgi:1,4-dihydroxy-2-naphthoyl-CoA hydrolase